MKLVKTMILAVALLAIGLSRSDAQVATKKIITLELAKKIAAAAEVEARKNNWTVFVAIVDDGANLVYLQRMDNTQIGSLEVAIQKARTAISFKRPTKSYEDAVAGGRTAILGVPGIVPIEGGLPIIVDGQYIGAIGVSGGTAQQDGLVAKAALEILNQ
ncbi:MAG: heme-binding protein [Ignavibacteriales bacterium]|nr:heme-binding protein [Ignavibacteriales bacterium]